MTARVIFWASLLLVVYTYLLYPLLLFVLYVLSQAWRDLRYLLSRPERRRPFAGDELPSVTVVVPALDEEGCLPAKLRNLAELDYPRDRLEVVFVSDGSTDRTNEILCAAQEPWLSAVILPERGGKASALNRGVSLARGEILVLSDASTLFAPRAIRALVRHFVDPEVGVVCGSLRFVGGAESEATEGVYWRYESALRLMEARIGATLTASGAIYAIRREAYRDLAADVILDDFVVPMTARRLGYAVLYDPEAWATEFAAGSVAGEFTRRVRVALGSYRALGKLAGVPLGPAASLAFVSHKLLRWLLPFVLLPMLVASAWLIQEWPYKLALFVQLAFYLWAGIGFVLRRRVHAGIALLPYYLTAMHLAFLVGFLRYLRGEGTSVWQKAQ